MKNSDKINKVIIASALALISADSLMTSAYAATTQSMEKCYGIVKAGMNDCKTSSQSCAGSAVKDKQADAFVFVPTGLCNKIVGGSLIIQSNEEKK